jgi:hypothetical protein
LAACDFRLFGPMKYGLRGQHFRSYDAVVATYAGAHFYERGM